MAGANEPTTASSTKSQADGASGKENPAPRSGRPPDRHPFSATVTWSGAGDGCGTALLPQGNIALPVGGAKALGGCGIGANPEEMLDAAIGACFVNTWAIFLKKLNLDYRDPSVHVASEVAADPAGGYRVVAATISARVPAALLAESRSAVEKTLALAEKYCIISRAVKGSVALKVAIEEV